MELNPYILTGCPVETALEYCEGRLSHSIEDYPEGILIPIDKPLRWTSADLVRKIKFQLQKHFHTHKLKVGHAGTLDPMATGLLIVCVGRATKIAETLQAHEKEYLARIAFGATTASYDLEQPVDQFFPYDHLTREGLEAALQGFIGEQEQVPPMYSAKMVGGFRAYEFARAGEEVELRTAHIVIRSIELLDWREAGEAEGPQAEAVHQYIEAHRQYPIIVCGDFNDNPISYSRRIIAQGLTDCFVETGRGVGLSYNQKGFFFRIDHIMCSDHFKPYNCSVDNKIDASDHYPISCRLKLSHKP